MKVLIINCGSSSIKFHLYKMPEEELLIQGKAERTGTNGTLFRFKTRKQAGEKMWSGFSYGKCLEEILRELVDPGNGCVASLNAVDVVGHRLIHGGEKGTGCTEITNSLISYMESCIPIAPLHYPANLEGIRAVMRLMPGVLQTGVFDTAFHHTLPPKAFLYGIPLEWYRKHKIRRYGFHGTSHKYASMMTCKIAGLPVEKSRVVSCHLGNGASVAAVKNGKSVDTSMGFTPAEGLLMGTRSGDIDAGVLVFLQKNFNLSVDEIQNLINREGGLIGLSGVSSDFRDVEDAAAKGGKAAQISIEVYHYRVKKYIGAYAAALEGIDALVFTGGIGENSIRTREKVCCGLKFMGIRLSAKRNRELNGREGVISKKSSKIPVVIVPANEELMIARETAEFLWIKNYRDKIL